MSLCLDESCDPGDLGRCILCCTTSKKMFIKQNIESYGKDGYFLQCIKFYFYTESMFIAKSVSFLLV